MRKVQQQIINDGRTETLVGEEGQLLNRLEERRKHEEILWKQKSRTQWLRQGEKNTRFFHKAMIQHHQHNKIFSLVDHEGNCLTQKEDMENLLFQRLQNLLT